MKPIELTSAQVSALKYKEGEVKVGGVFATKLENGVVCRASDGQRLILIASGDQMYYLLLDKKRVFAQDTQSFIQDMNAFPIEEAGRRSYGMMRLARAQIEFMMGLAGVMVPGGFYAVTGTEVLKFAANNGKLIVAIGKACHAVAKANGILQVFAPNLHRLLQTAFLRVIWIGLKSIPSLITASKSDIPDSITDEQAGRLAGGVAGTISIADLKSNLGILKAVFKVICAVLLKAGLATGKAIAGNIRQGDPAVMVELITTIKQMGITIGKNEGPLIMSELKRSAKIIKPVLEDAVRNILTVEILYTTS